MWECPNVSEIDGKDCLIFSPQEVQKNYNLGFHNGNNSIYVTGKLDYENAKFTRELRPENGYTAALVDYGIYQLPVRELENWKKNKNSGTVQKRTEPSVIYSGRRQFEIDLNLDGAEGVIKMTLGDGVEQVVLEVNTNLKKSSQILLWKIILQMNSVLFFGNLNIN